MYKKLLCAIALPVVIVSSSCGKEPTDLYIPPSIVTLAKDAGITGVSGNAYPSLGSLAKEKDGSGKNHIIEMDNPLKYNINGKLFTYYSFSVNIKANYNSSFFDLVKENGQSYNLLKIAEPNSNEINEMSLQSLKYTGDKTGPAVYSFDVADKLNQNGVVYWQNTNQQSENNSKYTFLIESSVIQPFKANSSRLKLHLKLKDNNTFDDWLELVRSPIHVAVIGDSVMWGQGLAKDEKFVSKIVKQIGDAKGQIVRVDNYARSGAVLGADNNNEGLDLDAEIAHPSPTINAQLKRVIEDFRPMEGDLRVEKAIDPKRIDLLVMDGGINNVGPSTIFLGFNATKLTNNDIVTTPGQTTVSNVNAKSIAAKVVEVLTSQDPNNKKLNTLVNDAFCYNESRNDFTDCNKKDNNIAQLMDTARRGLPNAQVDMMGYFPLLSSSSKLTCTSNVTIKNPLSSKPISVNIGANGVLGYATFMTALPLVGPESALIISGTVSATGALFTNVMKNNVVNRSDFWTIKSNKILNRAVELVNNNVKAQGRGLLRFIPVSNKFQEKAGFTKLGYLWGISDGQCEKDGEAFPPEDSVWKERKATCDGLEKNSFQKFYCARMSMFHPNIRGIDNVYVPEIITSLKESGFLTRKDL